MSLLKFPNHAAGKTTLITLTRDKPGMLLNLIKSVKESCDLKKIHTWVIVNNDSTDEFNDVYDDAVLSLGIESIIFKNDNIGNFSSMNNHAAELCKSEYVTFLNNDMVSTSDFVSPMIECIEMGAMIAGAVLHYPNGKLQHAGVIFSNNSVPSNLGFQAEQIMKFDPKKVHFYERDPFLYFQAVTAACLTIRVEDFWKLNGFHEEFEWCFEDVDLCLRAGAHLDGACVVASKSRLLHLESQSGGNRKVKWNLRLLQGRWHGIVRPDWRRFQPTLRSPAQDTIELSSRNSDS